MDTHTTMDRDQMEQVVALFTPCKGFSWLSTDFTESNIWQQRVHFVKTHFFLLFIIFFCYKTCTGCLEQQQKYNIQFICNFFHLIIINSLIIHQMNPTGDPLLSDCSESNVPNGLGSIWVLVGVRGTNKYRGQDVMKSKTGIFDTL